MNNINKRHINNKTNKARTLQPTLPRVQGYINHLEVLCDLILTLRMLISTKLLTHLF